MKVLPAKAMPRAPPVAKPPPAPPVAKPPPAPPVAKPPPAPPVAKPPQQEEYRSVFELNRSEPKAVQYVRPSCQEDETPAELASLREEDLKATARCKQLEEEVAALQKELAELAGPQSEMDKTRADDEKATFDKNHPEMVTAAEPVTELAGKGDQAHAELAARARATRRVTEPWMAARLGIALSEPLPPAPSPTDPNRWGRFDPDEYGPAHGLRSAPPAEPVESESSMARAVKRFKATLDARRAAQQEPI